MKTVTKTVRNILITLGLTLFLNPSFAQIDPFIGQIMLFGGNFCPRGWTAAEGQLLSISTNTALFSLYGTTYGGDGRTTFGLPDLRGRVPIGQGTGAGLSTYGEGQRGGQETVTLSEAQLPAHTHTLNADNDGGDSDTPSGNHLGSERRSDIYSTDTSDASMNSGAIATTGGGLAHENRPPYLAMRYCVALTGIYPSRS